MYASTLLVSESLSQILALGGTELTNSRRYIDATDVQAVSWQYKSSVSLDVRIDYSLNDGTTWAQLAAEYETIGTDPRRTAWQTFPPEANVDNLLLRAVAIGSGLLTTVNYVQVDYR